ncbi:MAG: hypothetical protein HZC40_23645 [Chloroflexi bacterium]|nr:hypothetical protein [Chloroflexota bacterium]
MINLGVLDIVLLVALVLAYVYSRRKHITLPFYLVLIFLVLMQIERLFPGLFAGIVHGIDALNAQMPHVQISPIITIK